MCSHLFIDTSGALELHFLPSFFSLPAPCTSPSLHYVFLPCCRRLLLPLLSILVFPHFFLQTGVCCRVFLHFRWVWPSSLCASFLFFFSCLLPFYCGVKSPLFLL
ncbi:hypothetical protein I3842_02G018100 [Carya illinoinensis]|uniref:Transmembrane protein n=1 Tax=Carya illinoinensis TaxID=32201 RepID=A0A922FQN0_CARIL|nr:hypothetical protein I3842_02G018100 [Carya illinoinensis]